MFSNRYISVAGLDLTDFASVFSSDEDDDVSRKAFRMQQLVLRFQNSFTSIEKVRANLSSCESDFKTLDLLNFYCQCPKPVIAAIHGPCIGGGIDMICACDIRYCTSDAQFQIKVRETRSIVLVDFQRLIIRRKSTWVLLLTWAPCKDCPRSSATKV